MNLLDAVKSGKKFKRLESCSWHDPASSYYLFVDGICEADILADDWIIEQEVAVTSTGFQNAVDRVNVTLYKLPGDKVNIADYLEELKKELGL